MGVHILNDDLDIVIQDQTTPPISAYFSTLEQETETTADVSINGYMIPVLDATYFSEGKYVSIFNVRANRYYLGHVVSVSLLNITMDTPFDFAFPSGSLVTVGSTNMAVNGSTTPVVFGLRNTTEAVGSIFDINRFIFSALTASACNLAKFGDITALTKGLVARHKDGTYKNIFNVKSNDDMQNLMYDFDIIAATNPAQGQDGFKGRLTFNGQEKFGVTLRMKPGEDLQVIIQDDLTGFTSLRMIAQGQEAVED